MKFLFATVSFLTVFTSALNTLAAPNIDQILKDSDRARGGLAKGVQWQAELQSIEDGETSTRSFLVRTRGDDALVEIQTPARNKGEKFLFLDRNMWFAKPSLKKPVSISARSRMSGQAANGDIANTRFSRDYAPQFLRKEVVDGQSTVVLDLKSKDDKTTYDRITYWITEKDHLGIKSEFLNLQGSVLKRAQIEYKNTIQVDGKSVPFVSKVIIEDAFNNKNKSTLTYKQPKTATLPENIFDVNTLSR
jgi:hypothetical protein